MMKNEYVPAAAFVGGILFTLMLMPFIGHRKPEAQAQTLVHLRIEVVVPKNKDLPPSEVFKNCDASTLSCNGHSMHNIGRAGPNELVISCFCTEKNP